MKKTKTDRLQIRIDPELKAKLQALADADHRTLTNYVENLIRREAEKAEKRK